MSIVAPPTDALARLLEQYAPFAPAPLSPEIAVFQGRSLVEVWEAAEQLAGENLPAPFWAYPWAAGCALARVVLDHPEYVRDLRVLDLGAGGGIVAIAAKRAEAREVVANDVDPWAIAVMRLAAQRQRIALSYRQDDLTETISAVDGFDVVLCSDMAYEKRMAPKYQALLQRAKNRGARVLVADAGRTYFDASGMKRLAEYELEVPKDLEGVEVRIARVYEF
ncbi:MAG: class I SAM-dependent methyltransferase [Gemmatimonadota bacterium]